MAFPLAALLPVIGQVLDRVLPDKEARAKAELELAKLQQDSVFKEDDLRYGAITAEAKAKDPLTSRARPAFFYVMYVYILAAIPMGVIAAISPQTAADITTGVQAFLKAIPEILYQVFIAGFLGYTGARTYEKVRGAAG